MTIWIKDIETWPTSPPSFTALLRARHSCQALAANLRPSLSQHWCSPGALSQLRLWLRVVRPGLERGEPGAGRGGIQTSAWILGHRQQTGFLGLFPVLSTARKTFAFLLINRKEVKKRTVLNTGEYFTVKVKKRPMISSNVQWQALTGPGALVPLPSAFGL